mmetsp:Transcript_29244/g.72878  ORF Transcript_29244/g.72878 Transcript_29244/m.72878 type:complete len:245 (+) Transcript_29244:1424-2158(+)
MQPRKTLFRAQPLHPHTTQVSLHQTITHHPSIPASIKINHSCVCGLGQFVGPCDGLEPAVEHEEAVEAHAEVGALHECVEDHVPLPVRQLQPLAQCPQGRPGVECADGVMLRVHLHEGLDDLLLVDGCLAHERLEAPEVDVAVAVEHVEELLAEGRVAQPASTLQAEGLQRRHAVQRHHAQRRTDPRVEQLTQQLRVSAFRVAQNPIQVPLLGLLRQRGHVGHLGSPAVRCRGPLGGLCLWLGR